MARQSQGLVVLGWRHELDARTQAARGRHLLDDDDPLVGTLAKDQLHEAAQVWHMAGEERDPSPVAFLGSVVVMEWLTLVQGYAAGGQARLHAYGLCGVHRRPGDGLPQLLGAFRLETARE